MFLPLFASTPSRLGIALLLSVSLARAQTLAPKTGAARYAELSLEELMEVRIEKVFSASKYEQKVTRAPASVTIVTADEIAAFGHRTLADVLRSVRGLYVSNDSNYSYLGSRGFLRPGDYNMRTLVLVDGHRMNDNVYDAAYSGRENTLATDAIERVEVIRGPSSSIYGSSAFFGVVNIVTKSGHEQEGLVVSGELGSLDTREGRVSYGHTFHSGLEVYLSGNWYDSNGRTSIYYPEFDPARSADPRARAGGVAWNSDAETALQLFGKARYGEFTLSGFYTRREKTVPTASFLTAFGFGGEVTNDKRGYVDLQFHHEFAPLASSLHGRAFYDSYTYDADYPFDWAAAGTPPDIIPNRDYLIGEWAGTEWQVTSHLGPHTLVSGFEYRENLHQRQLDYDETQPRIYYINDDRAGRTFGAYVQGDFALGSQLWLNSGLRYDAYPGSFGGTFNPRVGLIYTPLPETTVKALYGRAFRAPNAYERFYYADHMPRALQPERVRTAELALDHYFARNYRASVSLYRYGVDDLIEQRTDAAGELFFGNDSSVQARGAEFELEGRFDSGWRARVNYARQRTEDARHVELTNSPRHLAKFNLIAPLGGPRFTAGVEVQYQGAVRTLAGHADGFALVNLTLTAHRVTEGLELSASLYNAGNTHYGYPGAEDHAQDILPQPGRTLHVRATYRF